MTLDIETLKKEVTPADFELMQYEKAKAEMESRKSQIDLDGLSIFYRLRKKWSYSILVFISILLIFQVSLTILVGRGYLDYIEYPWFISIVVTETFAQIIGLALIVVKFLFDKKDNNAVS